MTRKIELHSAYVRESAVTEPDLDKLEAAGKIRLSDDHRVELREAVTRYRENTEVGSVPQGEVVEVLEKLSRGATAFVAAFRDLDETLEQLLSPLHSPAGEAALGAIQATTIKGYKNGLYGDRSSARLLRSDLKKGVPPDLLKRIGKWQSFADDTLATLAKEKGGRPTDTYRDKLLDVALDVFAADGGKGKYTDTALGFIKAVLDLAKCKIADDTLKKAIQRRNGQKKAR